MRGLSRRINDMKVGYHEGISLTAHKGCKMFIDFADKALTEGDYKKCDRYQKMSDICHRMSMSNMDKAESIQEKAQA